jgi:hypothetical protein
MTELEFTCAGAEADLAAASPTVTLRLRMTETTGTAIHALALRCQLRIEPLRRRYDDDEAAALRDLFGDCERWGTTLKPLQLAFISQVVPGFTGSTDVELALPCSYDLDVAAHKYLYGLRDGEMPLRLLFSGTIFTRGERGVEVEPVPWHKEATFRLPVQVWRQALDLHFPGTAWVRVRQDTLEALHSYRTAQQLMTADDALERLLKEAGDG